MHAVRHCWTEAGGQGGQGAQEKRSQGLASCSHTASVLKLPVSSHIPSLDCPPACGQCRDHPCPERHLPVGFGEVTPGQTENSQERCPEGQ